MSWCGFRVALFGFSIGFAMVSELVCCGFQGGFIVLSGCVDLDRVCCCFRVGLCGFRLDLCSSGWLWGVVFRLGLHDFRVVSLGFSFGLLWFQRKFVVDPDWVRYGFWVGLCGFRVALLRLQRWVCYGFRLVSLWLQSGFV